MTHDQEQAMRQAAEDVSKAYDLIAWGHTERAAEILKSTRTALRQALQSRSDVEQQPADELRYLKETLDATIDVNAQLKRELALYKKSENARELGLSYEPKQQPVSYDQGWKDGYKHGAWASEQPASQRSENTAWVGLTDEEWQDLSDRYGMILFGRFKNEIEAKLEEKNT